MVNKWKKRGLPNPVKSTNVKSHRLYQINILKKANLEGRKFTPESLKDMTKQEMRGFIEKSPYETVFEVKIEISPWKGLP